MKEVLGLHTFGSRFEKSCYNAMRKRYISAKQILGVRQALECIGFNPKNVNAFDGKRFCYEAKRNGFIATDDDAVWNALSDGGYAIRTSIGSKNGKACNLCCLTDKGFRWLSGELNVSVKGLEV